jgi:hypothetical protein
MERKTDKITVRDRSLKISMKLRQLEIEERLRLVSALNHETIVSFTRLHSLVQQVRCRPWLAPNFVRGG